MKKVCLVPKLTGVGGMVSFQSKLAGGLAAKGFQVCYDLDDEPYQSVLVIGGTHKLAGLRRARRRGIPVVQRLDGMNWIHRRRWTGLRHFLRAEYGNLSLALIRRQLATHIVYQSAFSQAWWERVYGPTRVLWHVIYNGVDLNTYTPLGEEAPPRDRSRILLVEGTLGGGYEIGLETAINLGERLSQLYNRQVEIMVAGRASDALQTKWKARSSVPLEFTGQVPRERIPHIDRSAHLLYAADINAACPNSVIEALGCGLPVAAFNTGALPELVTGDAGVVVPYGGDAWKLDTPDVDVLAQAAVKIIDNQARYRAGARARAEEVFNLDLMVEGYLEVLGG